MAYEIKPRSIKEDLADIAPVLLITAVVAVPAYVLFAYFDLQRFVVSSMEFSSRYIGAFVLQSIFLFSVILIGVALYALRVRRLGIYASLELAVGIFAAMYASNELIDAANPNALTEAVLATVGGLYIIVRGLDNLQQAQQPKA